MRSLLFTIAVFCLFTTHTIFADQQKSPIVLDTNAVSLASVSEAAASRFGKTVLIEPGGLSQVVVHGLNLSTMSMSEFQAALSRNKLTAIESKVENTLIIMRYISARQAEVPLITSINASYDEWQWVTMVLETGKLHAPHLVPLLRPLVQKEGHFAGSNEANSLIVTAPYGIIRRLYLIIEELNTNVDSAND